MWFNVKKKEFADQLSEIKSSERPQKATKVHLEKQLYNI